MAVDDSLLMASAAEIGAAIAARRTTAVEMATAYLDRIAAIDRTGPNLRSVLSLNHDAVEAARALDAELAGGAARGPLHGVPLLIKDNIETADPVATTAGSMALADNVSGRDADAVTGLRAAGVVVLGKTNLSEWANFRSSASISGWSALGGQVRNPHLLDRTPCGSSSGSGAAVAAALAAAAVGTETNGSIICPSSMNGIVGFKPTIGLIGGQGIVPIAPSQDTAGPMTRTVNDAILLTAAMADGAERFDVAAALSGDGLRGRRIGILRFAAKRHRAVNALFETAIGEMIGAGATTVDIAEFDQGDDFRALSLTVLHYEFRASINAYLAATPPSVKTRSLADLIAFNASPEVADRELALFDQDVLEIAEASGPLDDPAYLDARVEVQRRTGVDGIDRLLAEHDLDLLVAPSASPAGPVDAINGDVFIGIGAGWMPAIAGYPHLSVPMGTVHGAPVGLSFIGTAGADEAVLAAGRAYEQRTNLRPTPRFLGSAAEIEAVAEALDRPATAC